MATYERLDYGSPDGSRWGGSGDDKIGFYGGTPQDRYGFTISQQTTRSGEVRVFVVPSSTGAHSYSTSAEETVTVSSIAAASAVVVVRSSTVPGIVMAGARAAAADSLGINMMNFSTATIVPVSTQAYQVVEFKPNGGFVTTVTWSPQAVAASTTAEQSTTVPGVMPGMMVVVNKPTAQTALGIVNARVTAASTVAVTFANISSAAITPTASESYTFAAFGTLLPATPVVQYAFPGTTFSASVGVTTATEVTSASVNMNSTDFFVGATVPASQSGLFISNGRVNSSGVLALEWTNVSTSAQTPTSSVMYGVTILRPESRPAVWVTTATFPGTTVAASTTVEYTTTCNGLQVSSVVFVNMQGATANIGVANARVSAANTLCVALCNAATTATAIGAVSYYVGVTPQAPAIGIGAGPFQAAAALNSTCSYMSYQVAPNAIDAGAQLRAAFAENGFMPG